MNWVCLAGAETTFSAEGQGLSAKREGWCGMDAGSLGRGWFVCAGHESGGYGFEWVRGRWTEEMGALASEATNESWVSSAGGPMGAGWWNARVGGSGNLKLSGRWSTGVGLVFVLSLIRLLVRLMVSRNEDDVDPAVFGFDGDSPYITNKSVCVSTIEDIQTQTHRFPPWKTVSGDGACAQG